MNLYLVALLVPEPLRSELWALKQELHERTGSRNAIRLPPHLTLMPPLRQPPAFAADAAAALRQFAAGQAPCPLHVRNFAWFQHRTLYARVVDAAALQQLHAAWTQLCAQLLPAVPPPTRPFVPHLTLATRDLPPDQVPALRAEFAARSYVATAELRELALFRHDGRQWQQQALAHLGTAAHLGA